MERSWKTGSRITDVKVNEIQGIDRRTKKTKRSVTVGNLLLDIKWVWQKGIVTAAYTGTSNLCVSLLEQGR